MRLTSTAFQEGEKIPSQYTCDGDDVNPPLHISEAPDGTASFALVMDDPDAPGSTWDHWIVWDISPDTDEIAENSVPPNARQGTNDFQRLQWGGPCPPNGTHRYMFILYALDIFLDLEEGATKDDLEQAMQGHILAQAQLLGYYQKLE